MAHLIQNDYDISFGFLGCCHILESPYEPMCQNVLDMISSRYLVLIFSVLMLISCASRPPNLVGLAAVEQPLVLSQGATIQNLFVATSRQRSEDAAEFFSGERSSALYLGNVDVTIPPI